jgi:hypothetical protein
MNNQGGIVEQVKIPPRSSTRVKQNVYSFFHLDLATMTFSIYCMMLDMPCNLHPSTEIVAKSCPVK